MVGRLSPPQTARRIHKNYILCFIDFVTVIAHHKFHFSKFICLLQRQLHRSVLLYIRRRKDAQMTKNDYWYTFWLPWIVMTHTFEYRSLHINQIQMKKGNVRYWSDHTIRNWTQWQSRKRAIATGNTKCSCETTIACVILNRVIYCNATNLSIQ